MITVTVNLHTILQKETPQGRRSRLQLELYPPVTLAEMMDNLAIPLDEENLLLVINGRLADPQSELQDQDEIHLIPAISGGDQ